MTDDLQPPTHDPLTDPQTGRPMIFPGHFVAPTNAPLYLEATMQPDDQGTCWVMMRAEHVNGTFACFATVASAESFVDDLQNAIQRAKNSDVATLVVPNAADDIDV